MKKLTAFLAAVALMTATASAFAFADGDRPITVTELPAASQQFIKAHFPNHQVSHATVDNDLMDKDYEVLFTDGCKIKFAKNGEWKEVSHRGGAVPDAIIPQPIRNFVTKNHPNQKIRSIDRDRRGCEIELNNGLELTFDKKYKLIGIDN